MQQRNHELNRKRKYIRNLSKHSYLFELSRELDDNVLITESGVVEHVLSPLLLTFSAWVLQQAKKDNVKTLYFLARDGYPVYKMAKLLSDTYHWEIECRYFYCSRYSLRIPMYAENIPEALDHVCRGGIDVTFRKIMIRSGFSEKRIDETKKWFSDIDYDKVIPYPLLSDIKERLRSCPEYIGALKMASIEKWESLKAYFIQEGMLAKEKIGIVDSGWTGTTQKSICDIRRRCGCNSEVEGYYFGLYEKPDSRQFGHYSSFYFGPRHQLLNKLLFSNCLFETIFSADHGTTCGYIVREKVIPDLETRDGDLRLSNILKVLLKYGEDYVKHFPGTKLDDIPVSQYKKKIQKSLHEFMWNPTLIEADFFGTFRFSDDLLDQTTREVAPIFSEKYLKENHFINKTLTAFGIRKDAIHESAWFEASAVRSGSRSLYHRMSSSTYKLLSYIKKGI